MGVMSRWMTNRSKQTPTLQRTVSGSNDECRTDISLPTYSRKTDHSKRTHPKRPARALQQQEKKESSKVTSNYASDDDSVFFDLFDKSADTQSSSSQLIPTRATTNVVPTMDRGNQMGESRDEPFQFDLLDFSSAGVVDLEETYSQPKTSEDESIESLRQLCQPSSYQGYPSSYGMMYGYPYGYPYGYVSAADYNGMMYGDFQRQAY